MSSMCPSPSQILRHLTDMTDDQNVLSLRYKYGLTISQRIKEIFKEILNGEHTLISLLKFLISLLNFIRL